jgi:hypothetical protein
MHVPYHAEADYYMAKPDWNHMQKGQWWQNKNWKVDEWKATLQLFD